MQLLQIRHLAAGLAALGGLLAGANAALAQPGVELTVTTEGLREATSSSELFLSDPTNRFILVPPVEELMPPAAATFGEKDGDGGEGAGETWRDGVGVTSLFEVSRQQRCFVLGPFYRAAERLWLKARMPVIFERTLTYYDAQPSASGLGDLSLQVDYAWPLRAAKTQLRTRLDVVVPTGDSEKMDGEYLVPLGTGAWGFSLGGQYSRQTPRWGCLANLAVRRNTANSLTVQYVQADTVLATVANDITNASSLALSLFAWRSVGPKLAAHLGTSLLVVGDGTTEFSRRDAAGAVSTGSYGNGQGMVVIDLYPGVTYRLGRLNPFLGVRIPVVSSYDVERDREDRGVAAILQFTYQPGRMRHEHGE
jgi:hypothetical protein